jgi:hypothetical protein
MKKLLLLSLFGLIALMPVIDGAAPLVYDQKQVKKHGSVATVIKITATDENDTGLAAALNNGIDETITDILANAAALGGKKVNLRKRIDSTKGMVSYTITAKDEESAQSVAKLINDALRQKGYLEAATSGIGYFFSYIPRTLSYGIDQVGQKVVDATCSVASTSCCLASQAFGLGYTAFNWVGTALNITPSKAIKTVVFLAVIAVILETLNRYDKLYPVIDRHWDSMVAGTGTAYTHTVQYSQEKLTLMQRYHDALFATLKSCYQQLDPHSPFMVSLGHEAQLKYANAEAALKLWWSGHARLIEEELAYQTESRYNTTQALHNETFTFCETLKNVTSLCGNGAYSAIVAMCKQHNVMLPPNGIGCNNWLPAGFIPAAVN